MIIVRCIVGMPKDVILSRIKIGKYYRTTVPREVGKILELKENEEVEWFLEDGKIIIRRGENEH